MAATASPTPLPSTFSSTGLSRRPSSRQTYKPPSRPLLRRGSPLSTVEAGNGNIVSMSRKYSVGDSSDDDVPAPIKFSAVTKALLGEDASALEASPGYGDKDNNDD